MEATERQCSHPRFNSWFLRSRGLFLQRAQILLTFAFPQLIPQAFKLSCVRRSPDTEVNKIRSLPSRRLLQRQAEHKPRGKPHPPVTEPLPQAHKTRLTLNVTTCYVASRQGNWARLGRAGISQACRQVGQGFWVHACHSVPTTSSCGTCPALD